MITFYEALLKLGWSPKDLARRKSQVPVEALEHVPVEDYSPARITVQAHDAERAGPHQDLRLIVGKSDKAISFVPPKGLPKKSGERRLLVRQPDHVAEYADWEGEIPSGEYGAGSVRLTHDSKAVARTSRDKIDLDILKGELKGRYVFRRLGDKHWLAIRRPDPLHHWEERPPMGRADESLLGHPDWLAERKYDGIHVIARFDTDRGVTLAARSKSATGDIRGKEAHVPWIRDIKVPREWHGTVARGELYHPKLPFGAVSGMAIADPDTAVGAQRKVGPLRLVLFSLVRGPKGREMGPVDYAGQAAALHGLTEAVKHPLIHTPETEETDKAGFFQRIAKAGGEGVVLKHRMTGQAAKLTRSTELDLQVVGFEPGHGDLSGRGVGALKLADKHGRYVGDVGAGLTAQVRQDAMRHPEKYLHRIIRVEAKEVTPGGSLRQPIFKGHSVDRHEADLVPVIPEKVAAAPNPPAQGWLGGMAGLAKLAESVRDANKKPLEVGEEVLVQLEKGRGFKVVAMGRTINRGTNPADGMAWDVILADAPGGAGGRFQAKVVGKITTPDGNDKWIATKDGRKPTQEEIKQLRAYRAARQELIGKKMHIQLDGVKDKQVKIAVGDAALLLLRALDKEASLKERLEELGIVRREPGCIGTDDKGKWWGWSHRAIFGFKAGDVVEKGSCLDGTYGGPDLQGHKIKNEEDAKRVARLFAESVS